MPGVLEGKTAIIYGSGGIGRAVSRSFAEEGARVFVAARNRATLDLAVEETSSDGGSIETAVLDATDERAVDEHARDVVAKTGTIDVSFNLISRGDVQGTPLVEMATDDVLRAVTTGLQSNFITARAAARQMVEQRSGVILHLNSASGPASMPGMGSTGPADAATESFMRYLAAEVGPHGVRVVGIWTAGVEETLTDASIAEVSGAGGPSAQEVVDMIAGMAALRRTPRLADVTNVATFLASDRAAGMTGTVVNVTAGLVLT